MVNGPWGCSRRFVRPPKQDRPVLFGDADEKCIYITDDGTLGIGDTAVVPAERVFVHNAHHEKPGRVFALAHLSHGPKTPTCIGVFRDVERPVYGEMMDRQVEEASTKLGPGDLDKLLHAGDTWDVV